MGGSQMGGSLPPVAIVRDLKAYLDGRLAIFHSPRRLARYTADGQLQTPELQVVA